MGGFRFVCSSHVGEWAVYGVLVVMRGNVMSIKSFMLMVLASALAPVIGVGLFLLLHSM